MIDFALIGLSNRDKKVYEALLTMPRSSVRKIAEETGINRGSVFESIKALVSVGLVAYIEEGSRRHYVAQGPELLHEVVAERRRDLRVLQSEIDNYISVLEPSRNKQTEEKFASFYEGDEGLANILRDVLSTCRQQSLKMYRVVSSPKIAEYMYNNFPHYTRERIAQKLFVRSLRQSNPPAEEAELSEFRLLGGGEADTGCYILIYGSKVATISIDKFNFVSGIVVDNAGVAAAQTLLFDASWARSSLSN